MAAVLEAEAEAQEVADVRMATVLGAAMLLNSCHIDMKDCRFASPLSEAVLTRMDWRAGRDEAPERDVGAVAKPDCFDRRLAVSRQLRWGSRPCRLCWAR